MPYYLTKTNGETLVTVEDGTIDTTTTDLALLGKNYPTYGLNLNLNFVKLLENFASIDEPAAPLLGQLWYDSDNKTINYRREGATADNWQKIATMVESDTAPSDSRIGDLWWDTSSNQLKTYDGSDWVIIGPQTSSTGLLRVSGTNPFRVQIGGTEVLNVDSNGRFTTPLNPVVQASGRTGSTNYSGTGSTNFDLWIPSTVAINVGSYFSSGTFTAPVDGKYRVHVNLVSLGKSGSAAAHVAQWRVNDVPTTVQGYTYHQDTTRLSLVASGVLDAQAGDLITLVVATDSGGSVNYQYNSYSIELVG